jgi:hypothetical protein
MTLVLCVVAPLAMSSLVAQAAALDRRELEARKDFAEARYQDSLHLFADLFAQFGDPIYLRNIARCYQKMKQPAEAIASFQEYLAKGDVSSNERAQIASYISEMEALQARQKSPAAGVPATVTPSSPPTPPTTTQVRAPASGQTPPSNAVATATPPSPRTAPAATPWRLVEEPASERGHQRILRWTGLATGAVGVALVGLGIGFGMAAHDAQKSLEVQYDAARDADRNRDYRLQWITYSARAAALAAGVVLFVAGGREPASASDSSVRAMVGPAGMAWEGHF